MTTSSRSALSRIREGAIAALLFGCALISVLTTAGIITVLISQSIPFFKHVSVWAYLFGTEWAPQIGKAYGVLPLVCGTLLVAGGALVFAVPVGLCTAIFLSEYASPRVRAFAKPILEILAGVPTVVYGYFALLFITPLLKQYVFPSIDTFNALSAAVVVGIMIVPTIASLCDDAFRAVPRTLREGAHALAATRVEVATRVVFPAALSGVIASILLALARAIGETMAVALAAGMTPKLTLNPLTSIQTMTAYIVQVSSGDTPQGTVDYYSIFAVGLTLFAMTLAINLIAQRVLQHFREEYE